jgi:hypothetical protein
MPLWSYFGWTYWDHLHSIRPFAKAQGNEGRIAETAASWDALPENVKQKLTIPLDRLNRALGAPLPVDCAIELGVALEALLLPDLGPNEQLSLAFRLRGAWLMGATPAERVAFARQFNDIYGRRSPGCLALRKDQG